MNQPIAKKIPKTLTTHDDVRNDDYYWLNDRENKEVIEYLEAENAYREGVMAPLKDFQEILYQEIVGRIKQTDMSVPYLSNGYYYYSRFEEGAQYAIHCRKKGSLDSAEEVMLDLPEMSKGFAYYSVGGLAVSPNNQTLAYGVDTISRRIYIIHFQDLATGATLETTIPNTTGSSVWANDSKTLFYQVKDEALRSYKIFKHKLGTDAKKDVCVWHEKDETFSTHIYKTRSKKFLVIGSSSTVSNEFRILEADNPDGKFRLFQKRERDLEYSIDHYGDDFYIVANLAARNFRLMRTKDTKTGKKYWEELIPHREDVLLEGLEIFKDWMVISERKEGITQLRVMTTDALSRFPVYKRRFDEMTRKVEKLSVLLESYQTLEAEDSPETMKAGQRALKKMKALNLEFEALDSEREKSVATESDQIIDFGETVYVAYTGVNKETDTDLLRVGYTSMTTPSSVFEYNMRDRKLTLLKQEEVLGGQFQVANYQGERVFATAKDGTQVPISLVYRKDRFQKDGKSPLLLYAYGSYGHSMDPYFSSARLSLLDRGFGFAIAHIRGGQEMGRHWYEDGKLLKKMNTFTDFIDCADYLLKAQYTSSERLFAMGGSAGGLLMGAVMNMRPELWRGVVAQVPFVDVVTTMLDESIPLTTGEFDEWGNPKNKEYYDYMKSYSPYDNVEAKAYPTMLVTTGLHDSQVQYWEPAKWVAKLRELKTDNHPLLMYCNMSTGHGGASGRWERYKELAMEYAFLLWQAGKQ